MSSMLYWKGKRVSQKQYDRKLLQQRSGMNRSKRKSEDAPVETPASTCKRMKPLQVNECAIEIKEEPCQDSTADAEEDRQVKSNEGDDGDRPEEVSAEVMGGRRIVELAFLGEQMWCYVCKEALSLQYITKEVRKGLGSILTIRCHKCLLLNEVKTGKTHCDGDRRSECFDVNPKSVLGALQAGLGWTHLNKLFTMISIPCYNFQTFKRYKNEVGHVAEDVAKKS